MEANKCESIETDKKHVSDEINEYINQMDELERKSYFIAKNHLESSFSFSVDCFDLLGLANIPTWIVSLPLFFLNSSFLFFISRFIIYYNVVVISNSISEVGCYSFYQSLLYLSH